MLDQVLRIFEITPDYDLNIMKVGQDLYDITSRVLLGMRDILNNVNPDIVLVHGDTTTSTAAALAAFYQQIPVGHVEAGLRTHNIYSPWPEEMNRRMNGQLCTFHFAPTDQARHNLLRDGVPEANIAVTGNTVIDALQWVVASGKATLPDFGAMGRMVLVTAHRRENFGDGLRNICLALNTLATRLHDIDFIYPVHPNPNVRQTVEATIDHRLGNIHLIEPQPYLSLVALLQHCTLVLTDSGGLQEEAPAFGKPVLVMRDTTERPEAVEAGTALLVGTYKETIVEAVTQLITDPAAYSAMANIRNPFGDGHAAERIADYIERYDAHHITR
jgi:UDP-N-acetylglucosamine 2-epimerase (non-hydrolysing)